MLRFGHRGAGSLKRASYLDRRTESMELAQGWRVASVDSRQNYAPNLLQTTSSKSVTDSRVIVQSTVDPESHQPSGRQVVQSTDHQIQPITFIPLTNIQLTKFNQMNSYPMDVIAGGGIYPLPYPFSWPRSGGPSSVKSQVLSQNPPLESNDFL